MQRILFILLVLVCGCSESGDDDTSTGSSCSTTVDCAGECGGSAVLDCNDECNGTATEDNCGVCDSNASNDDTTCTEDCLGVWGSTTPAPEIADIDDGCDLVSEIHKHHQDKIPNIFFLVQASVYEKPVHGSAYWPSLLSALFFSSL